jgi:hypothetical protein
MADIDLSKVKWDTPAIESSQVKWDESPGGGVARAGVGGMNRGIAGVLGMPVDAIENVLNLGIAGVGSVANAVGKPDLAPNLIGGSVGGSQWLAGMMEKLGINASNPNPQDTASQMAFRAGTIAPTALIPGAAVKQTALSAGGAAIGEQVGGETGAMVGAMAPAVAGLRSRPQPNPVRAETMAKAREEGYRFPPAETNPNLVNRALEGWAGKLSTRQMASAKNAEVTTNIAKRSIGLGPDDVLDEASILRVRENAGQAYESIKRIDKPFEADGKLKTDIASLDSAVARASKEYPDIVKNPGIDELKAALDSKASHNPEAIVELIKDLRLQAKGNYKGSHAAQKPAQQIALADAQRKAADIMESFVERSLSRTGQQDLIKDFRQARTTIARTYDIESALNDASGTVNARVFASLSDKGRPLGGGLETVAKTYKAFPHDLKTPESIGSQPGISPLDVGAGAIVASGNVPALMGMMLGRPLVRSAIMSKPYQAMMGTPSNSPLLTPDSGLASLLRGHLAGNMTQ